MGGTLEEMSRSLGKGLSDPLKLTAAAVDSLDKSLKSMSKTAAKTAAATTKTTRALAAFDEINRLTGQTAAAAAKSSGKSSGGTKSAAKAKTQTAKEDAAEQPSLWAQLWNGMKTAAADFWSYLQSFYAPSIAAWSAAWEQIKSTALAVWQPVKAAALSLWEESLAPLWRNLTTVFLPGIVNSFSEAFAPIVGGVVSTGLQVLGNLFVWLSGVAGQLINGVLLPGLALVQSIWQGLMEGITNAWAAYGAPLLQGVQEAFGNLCGILSTLLNTVILPVLQTVMQQLDALWQTHLQPLWNDLTLALGAVGTLVLNLWNRVLAPLANWLIATLGPVFSAVFRTIAQVVTVAVGLVADVIDMGMVVLRGLADFVSAVLNAQWSAAWNAMASTVSAVWSRIVSTIQNAVSGVVNIISNMISTIANAINSLFSRISSIKSSASSILSGGYSFGGRSVAVPALASGAVIPPNRQFLAVLGDQHSGTNIEAPLDTIRQAFAETLAGFTGGTDQPINIYLGDELLDSVIARSQSRRLLRSGGRG